MWTVKRFWHYRLSTSCLWVKTGWFDRGTAVVLIWILEILVSCCTRTIKTTPPSGIKVNSTIPWYYLTRDIAHPTAGNNRVTLRVSSCGVACERMYFCTHVIFIQINLRYVGQLARWKWCQPLVNDQESKTKLGSENRWSTSIYFFYYRCMLVD